MTAKTIHPEPIDSAELDEWIRTEGVRRLEYLKAHPESGISPEQMDAYFEEDEKLLHDNGSKAA